ncbi:MAG TPA: type 2 lanthipeptide synthetase LanM family protein [Thermoanaerobaculia bacterium]|nr:type 2 lanthipeptide synthetase LanM family protein [Thermoanaerobaculia bacterium]
MTLSLAQFAAALTLEERAALRERAAPATPVDERARKKLERWRTQSPFDRDGFFPRRLAQNGLDEEGLLALLAEPPEALAERWEREGEPAAWLRELDEAFRLASPGAPLPFATGEAAEPEVRLTTLAAPLVQQAERRLAAAAAGLIADRAPTGRPLPFDAATIAPLVLSGLANQLRWTITRAAVLELNVARLEGRIAGETPEERFAAFVERLGRPEEALAILRTYPVLGRQLALRLGCSADAGVELLSRLAADWDEILEACGPTADPGPLTEVATGAGDRHRGGRTVCLLTFASGWRLAYKPRPMQIAAHFQDLLGWIGERGFAPGFRRLGVLARDSYGWMEFAAAFPCGTRAEVVRFYQRMGGYLALLYALDATDIHYENLIAAGEHPVLIDLESIVQPRVPAPPDTGADWVANQILGASVLRIGLLPQRFWGGAGGGIDLSGLGSPDGQLTPDRFPLWEARGTDEMQLQRQQLPMAPADNRPTLGGREVDVNDHVEELIDGFSRLYRLLWAHRGELLAAGGPIARMAGDEIRVLLRPTRTYALLLQESFHPFLLRDALERDRHFDHLWQGVAESPAIETVVAAERRELHAADIPLFTSRLGSRDLAGAGGERWPELFASSGLELIDQRLAALGEEDLAKQAWFIRASLAAHRANLAGVEDEYAPAASLGVATAVDRDRLLAAAVAVGDRLATLALRGSQDATWIGLRSVLGRDWHLRPLGSDLYSGLPGVAVFLSHLAEITGDERHRQLARAGWRTLWREWETLRGVLTSVGGFDGWGGLLWALCHLGRLWDDRSLLDEAHRIVERLPALIAKDAMFDVLNGAAGCLAGLLAFQRTEPSDRTLAAAVACGEHLLRHAQARERGAGWASSSAFAAQPLAGFAHGASGVAWALLELESATGDGRFRQTALDAFEYERGLYVPEQRNWRDVREFETLQLAKQVDDNIFMMAWCHGAPGVGLARLRALRHLDALDALDGPRLRSEAVTALESTRDGGFDRSHCLCHGDLGNAEIFLQAAGVLDDPQRWRAELDGITAFVLANIAEHGWRCGLPGEVEVPGLMTGLAGIGYGLLRLAAPERVPSVLLLEPPVS